jgi:enolase
MSRSSEAQELQKALGILYPDHYAQDRFHIDEVGGNWHTPYFGPKTNTQEGVSKLYDLYLKLKTSFPRTTFCNLSIAASNSIDALDKAVHPCTISIWRDDISTIVRLAKEVDQLMMDVTKYHKDKSEGRFSKNSVKSKGALELLGFLETLKNLDPEKISKALDSIEGTLANDEKKIFRIKI